LLVSFFASTRAKHSPEQAPAGATNTRQNQPRRVVPCVLSVTKDQKRVIKVWGGWPTPSHLIHSQSLRDRSRSSGVLGQLHRPSASDGPTTNAVRREQSTAGDCLEFIDLWISNLI
jgi:hypothetical protein